MILGWNPEIARILGLMRSKIVGLFFTGEEERTGLS
jgi:hypothetical protein